ncbi:MAG: tRNA (N6-threonylcarbamoyladenosine(37)-N6)-methyltransferase TrmO, partial [Mesorhizobium sp.]
TDAFAEATMAGRDEPPGRDGPPGQNGQ